LKGRRKDSRCGAPVIHSVAYSPEDNRRRVAGKLYSTYKHLLKSVFAGRAPRLAGKIFARRHTG
jgi:hypothetical protein